MKSDSEDIYIFQNISNADLSKNPEKVSFHKNIKHHKCFQS